MRPPQRSPTRYWRSPPNALPTRGGTVAHAHGTTLDIGAGTGLNLDHYPAAVTNLTLVEPDRHMRKRLLRRAARVRPGATVLDARAESLPVPDDTVDTVVVTFVLCSVDDQYPVLEEITRVLRPGGQLDPKIAHKQDDAPFLYSWIGCPPNRTTLDALTHSKLSVA